MLCTLCVYVYMRKVFVYVQLWYGGPLFAFAQLFILHFGFCNTQMNMNTALVNANDLCAQTIRKAKQPIESQGPSLFL